MSDPIPCVIYAAKSTEDKHGSIPTQLADCRELAERQEWQVVDEFSDEAFSAYSGNRGPGLERAKQVAADTAAEHGRCALVAQDADRFARGAGDEPGAADHLGEVYFTMKRQAVELWTVRSGHLDLLRAAIEGERSHDESARKTQAVKAGKRRQAERGEHLGGPAPDGYRGETYEDEKGKQRRRLVLDPDRADVVRGIFKLAAEGVPDAEIARRLNVDGITTRKGNPWTRRAVQNTITRAFYAGRITHDGETYKGEHQWLVQPSYYDRLIAARGERDLAASKHTVGRPATLHALQGLATCAECGRHLYSRTSSYTRKDGSKARQYVCPSYAEANGSCSVTTFDAPTLDAAVLSALDELVPDFEKWLSQIGEREAREHQRLEKLRDRCVADRDDQAHKVEAVEAKWASYVADGDERKAETVLPMVEREREILVRLQTRAQAAEDAASEAPTAPPADAVLDFAVGLREALSGVDTDGTMAAVNAELRRTFGRFLIQRDDGGNVRITPELHLSVAEALMIETGDRLGFRSGKDWSGQTSKAAAPPPMKWLTAAVAADGNPEHAQAQSEIQEGAPSALTLPVIEVAV